MNVVLELRQRAGLTQVLLAELSGVRPSTISRYENGHASPTLETLERLAGARNLRIQVAIHAANGPDPSALTDQEIS